LPGVEVVEGDISDVEFLKNAMQGVETVLDYAQATANLKNKDNLYYKVNVQGTRNVVAAAESAGVKLLILGSGLGTVEGKPGSYMRTRWEAEEAVRKSKLNWIIFQPSILFGPGAEFFDAQARLIKLLPIATIIGNGKTRFQPIYVNDVARAVVESISHTDKIGKHIPIGGPQIFTYKELIKLMVQNLNKKRILFYLPLLVANINAAMFSVLPNPPLTPATLELFGFENITKDPNIVEHEFGFKPTSLDEYFKTHTIG
jgi:NADH dehydrogenase